MLLYVDCSAGLSGDMFLAGLVDLGFPLKRLHRSLEILGVPPDPVQAKRIRWDGNWAIRLKFQNNNATSPAPRQVGPLLRWIKGRPLESQVKQRLLQTFRFLAQAESQVHRTPLSKTIFHQLARVDTWVNLLGVAEGLEFLGVQAVYTSQVPIGSWHQDPHGRWQPIPGPATQTLLRRFPIDRRTDRFEWTTPTGAALLATFGSPVPAPPFRILRIGRGVGHGHPPHGPTALKLLLGRPIGRGTHPD